MGFMAKIMAAVIKGDRRTRDEPVAVERREKKKPSYKEAHDRLHDAMKEFQRTVSVKRDELLKRSANDVQQEVQFETFRQICAYKVEAGEHRICRHPQHEAANTGIAPCDENLCPFMLGKSAA